MKNFYRSLLLGFVFTLFTQTGFAQQIDSMMMVYSDGYAPEKIHIHFDKSIYNKGETVWYKIYILQRGDSTSKNVYLEWYDADGKIIFQSVAPMLLSSSQGSFDIPATYKGASLHVKAFTKWMLNDDTAFSYHRELVVNTNTPSTIKSVPYKTTVTTFPEGGYLVNGVNARVAFKATNQYGNPVLIKGTLVDAQNTIIDTLNVQHDGMGSFFFTPSANQTYQLQYVDENGVKGSVALPAAKNEGACITLTANNGKAIFQIERSASAPNNIKKMTLVVHMNQVALYQVSINTTQKTIVQSTVPTNDLPTGLLQFTLFTEDWIPLAERVIFVNNHKHEFQVQVATPLVNMEKRAKNTIELLVPDTLFTNMSLAITDATVTPPDQHSIFSDILLSSEIKGKVYNPTYYFQNNSDSVAANLDLVMLTNGWRRFNWDKIKAGVPPVIKYPMETESMKMQGKVIGLKKKNKGQVLLNMVVVDKDSSKQLIFVPIEEDGSFEYPMVFFDTSKVLYSFNNNPSLNNNAELQLNNGLLKRTPTNIPISNSFAFALSDSIAKLQLSNILKEQEILERLMSETTLKEVTVKSKVKTKIELLNEKYATGYFTRGNASIFDLTDETKTMFSRSALEYLQGRVAGLTVKVNAINEYELSWRGDTPEFFLDEIRSDVATLATIPMQNIAMIKAYPPLFMFAPGGGAGGAIAVYTKKGDDTKNAINTKGLESTILPGYTRFKEFYSPDYEKETDALAKLDNRTTLYWNPFLITNKTQQKITIDFFNNDFTKAFNVVMEGINAEGKMTRVVKTINSSLK